MDKKYRTVEEAVNAVCGEASALACAGVDSGIGGPFGAGIIRLGDDGSYHAVSIACNTVIRDNDPTAHAEMNAIRMASSKLHSKFLDDCILVTTAKSCPMCLAAACWARIPRIYYSEDYDEATTSGFRDDSISQYIKGTNPELIEEVRQINPVCAEPFVRWNAKDDRIQY
ncbi:MAG: nucleoside deaminase [Saccharofermentans sp.]|jgi:guanine deaminase|nr:nucleoside deaminase [Mageeibacillus sp.]MCI1264355.1 nucleoside deaminase [Saccharofermentans sp.]MCI1275236.1 nucleoside deaminase [Saccharofermentans sp.]